MDHLPQPADSDPPRIEVPVLAVVPEDIFDDLHYMDYPSRLGYSCVDVEDQKFLIEWLFFGLLRVVLGATIETMSQGNGQNFRSKFIRTTPAGQEVLSTELLSEIMTNFLTSKPRRNSSHFLIKDPGAIAAIDLILTHARMQIDNVEIAIRDKRTSIAPYPELMLSLRILQQTLYGLLPDAVLAYRPRFTPHFAYPSMLPLLQHMSTERG
ncbi:hypothetical protein LTR17_017495 [Elasticomyces elasticus]|nr:hypothetical protein LTR17_017495 [Elasticomyces elasticus]